MEKAIVLLSGGLDSTVILAMALNKGRDCFALSFDYGQRNRIELESAQAIAKHYNVPHHIVAIKSGCCAKSALTAEGEISKDRSFEEMANGTIPSTYVPARNTLFLAYAMGYAEIFDAGEIYYGANYDDNAPYPDCTPEYVAAFQQVLNVGTKQAVEKGGPKLIAPVIHMIKKDIVRLGRALGAPLEMTFSCYDPTVEGKACKHCDTCLLREAALLS